MFFLLYNGLALLVWPLYLLAGLFSSTVREFQQSRRLKEFPVVPEGRPCLWLHAASVGELDQALAIVRELRSRKSSAFIVVSVFSNSVKRLEQPGVDWMFRMPIDFPWAHSLTIASLRPAAFVTMTWDVFPNLLRSLSAKKIPAFICSAALSPASSRLKFPLKQLLRPVYAALTGIGAVDELNRQLFAALHPNAEAVRVTGDSRYDSIFHRVESVSLSPDQEELLSHGGVTWILASTYRQCDSEILPGLPGLLAEFPDLRVLIFPHFVEESRLAQVEQSLSLYGIESGRFSGAGKPRVCIVDKLGLLALAYRFALFCYVGGAFHHRVHNTGEPAAAHLPVLTGPGIEASPVARMLAAEGCLKVCANGGQVIEHARAFLKDSLAARALGDKAYNVILHQRGSSRIFVDTFLRGFA